MNMVKSYEGVIATHCDYGQNITIGEYSYLRDSVLGDYVQINRRNILDNAEIGTGTYTGANTVLKQVVVGKYCSISWNVSATGNLHNYRELASHPLSRLKSFGFVDENISLEYSRISIGNDVWIGANAVILPGLNIGDGAVIGAGAVVTKDVPPYSIVVGNPGKVIKYRFNDEIISLLMKAQWWNWSREIIKMNIDLFQSEITIETARRIAEISIGEKGNG